MMYYPNLFKPLRIKNVTFRNRIFSTPNQTRFRGNIEMAYMEAKARGGAAQVSVGEPSAFERANYMKVLSDFKLS